MNDEILQLDGYQDLLRDLTARIGTAQMRAGAAVNREVIMLYWSTGKDILARQQAQGWGTRVIDRLSADLRNEFPDVRGFSARNLKYMRTFAGAWPDEAIVQQVLAQLPWGHIVTLLDRLDDPVARFWYAVAASQYAWSRNVLSIQIESNLYGRQGKAITNFDKTLPSPHSDLAQAILKDPYNFDFLTVGPEARERHVERGLLDHIQRFLLELGQGFAFLGRQYHIDVGGEDFYIDLLFYHVKLRCYFVIDLKMGKFQPEFAGKMNFYLSVVDDNMRHADDAPSIGLILCKDNNRIIAEYALRDISKPIGVAEYLTRLESVLTQEAAAALPSIEELEATLSERTSDEPTG